MLAAESRNVSGYKVKPLLEQGTHGTWKKSFDHFQPAFISSKVNNGNIRKMGKICSKLIIKTPEHQWRHSSSFIVDFEHVNAGWELKPDSN